MSRRNNNTSQETDYPTKIKLKFTTPQKSFKDIADICQNLNIYETPNNQKYVEENSNLKSNNKLKFMQSTCSNNQQIALLNSSNGKLFQQNYPQNKRYDFPLFSIEKERGNIFKSSEYSSENLNFLLGSDMKFKSPSKLVEIKISESPWISNQKRHSFLSQFFDSSPQSKSSGYKIGFSETTATKDTHDLRGRLDSNFYACRKYTNDFELKPVEESTNIQVQVPKTSHKENQVETAYEKRINDENKQYNHDAYNRGNIRQFERSCSIESESTKGKIKKRRRKTSQQLKALKNFFEKDQNWSKDMITKISKATGLTESQVYKWCWDQKKKVEEEEENGEGENKKINFEKFGEENDGNKFLGKRKPFSEVNDMRLGFVPKKLKI